MSFYETIFIARPDISAQQVEQLIEQFKELVASNEGSVTKTEYWGLKSLAYRIKKNRKGHYVLMNLDAPAPAVHELERVMRLNEDVMRTLTVRVEELEEGPSIQMQIRSNRDSRRRRGDDDRGPRGRRDDRGPREDRAPRGDRENTEGASE